MFHSKAISVSWAMAGLLVGACSDPVGSGASAGDSGESRRESGSSSAAALTNPAACPSASRKLFVVYYGLSTAEYDRIIAKQPAIVVLGDHKGSASDTTPAYFHGRDAAIKVLAYVPMNYGGTGLKSSSACPWVDGVDGACANAPKSFDCTAVAITTRVQNAMAVGYDGVFFDETPTNKPSYVQNCATLVKNSGGQKIVTMNPGTVPPASMLSDEVDIVSVENQFAANLLGFGARSARFMAEQGGVSDAATSLSRLNTFRVGGGYWYYATSSYAATLPAWFESFADAVNAVSDEPHDCGTNPVHVAFRTYQNVAATRKSPVCGRW